jgi:glycosidase
MRTLDLPSLEGGYYRTGSRTPMQWSDGANCGFSKADAKEALSAVDPAKDRPTVAGQDKKKDSLLNAVRSLVACGAKRRPCRLRPPSTSSTRRRGSIPSSSCARRGSPRSSWP